MLVGKGWADVVRDGVHLTEVGCGMMARAILAEVKVKWPQLDAETMKNRFPPIFR